MPVKSEADRIRKRKLFTLHPDVIEELRWLADAENTSMSRELERIISSYYRNFRTTMDEAEATVALAQAEDAAGVGSVREVSV